MLLGIYNLPNLFKREYVGVVFWQNNTMTKIKQDLWESENSTFMYDEYDDTEILENYNEVIVYNHYDV